MSSAARLRTKTGCMTCRRRRVKCTERRPVCHNCTKSGHECLWEAEDTITDRRFRQWRKSRSKPKPSKEDLEGSVGACAILDIFNSPDSLETDETSEDLTKTESPSSNNAVDHHLVEWYNLDGGDNPGGLSHLKDAVGGPRSAFSPETSWNDQHRWSEFFVQSNMLAAHLAHENMEGDLFRSLLEVHQSWLILPGAHPGFNQIWTAKLMELSGCFEGLKTAIIANGASRLYTSTQHSRFYELSLAYYAAAVSKVSSALQRTGYQTADFEDALLLAIIYMYIHGFMGFGTDRDIPQHVAGATQLVKRRLIRDPSSKHFNHLALESVLYQVFRISAFSWYKYDISVDTGLYLQAKRAFQDPLYPDESQEANTPVIGMPVQLQEFIVRLTAYITDTYQGQDAASLMEEMARWETELGVNKTRHVDLNQSNYQLATILYVLAASLVIDHFIQEGSFLLDATSRLPKQTGSYWQVRQGIAILSYPPFSSQWNRCFLGSWPALAFGLAANNQDEIAIIRNDIRQRWSHLQYSEALSVVERLEAVWVSRETYQGRVLTELVEE